MKKFIKRHRIFILLMVIMLAVIVLLAVKVVPQRRQVSALKEEISQLETEYAVKRAEKEAAIANTQAMKDASESAKKAQSNAKKIATNLDKILKHINQNPPQSDLERAKYLAVVNDLLKMVPQMNRLVEQLQNMGPAVAGLEAPQRELEKLLTELNKSAPSKMENDLKAVLAELKAVPDKKAAALTSLNTVQAMIAQEEPVDQEALLAELDKIQQVLAELESTSATTETALAKRETAMTALDNALALLAQDEPADQEQLMAELETALAASQKEEEGTEK